MNTKEFSSRQEHNVAKYLDWKVVTGSGSRNNFPGDIYSEDWLGECKTYVTEQKSIRFRHVVWSKICEEALSHFKYPAYFTDTGTQSTKDTWVMIYDSSVSSENLVILNMCRIEKNLTIIPENLQEELNRNSIFQEGLYAVAHYYWDTSSVYVMPLSTFWYIIK